MRHLLAGSACFLAIVFLFAFTIVLARHYPDDATTGPDAVCRAFPSRRPMTWRVSLPSGDTWSSGVCR